MKKKSIALGIVLILLAVYLVVSRLGFAPALPFFTIVFTLILAYTTIKGFVKLHFTEAFLSLAILGCIHDELLHIEALTPWTLLLVGLLLGIAFDMMFKGVRARRKNKDRGMFMEWDSDNGGHIEWESDVKVEDIPDGETVHVENTFGSKSKYVNSDAFSKAHIENSFGECNVYFNNAILAGNHAQIHAENSFGETNLYLPRTWRIRERQESAFGTINIHGRNDAEEGAPVVDLMLECSFGELNVYFE